MSDAAMNEAIEDRAGGIGGFSRAYIQRRYMVLFYSLLLTMVTVPASGVLGIDSAFIDLFLAANLLIAVVPLAPWEAGRCCRSTGRHRRKRLTPPLACSPN